MYSQLGSNVGQHPRTKTFYASWLSVFFFQKENGIYVHPLLKSTPPIFNIFGFADQLPYPQLTVSLKQ